MCCVRFALPALVLGIALQLGGLRPAAAAQCYLAASGNSHVLCWLDLTGYAPTNGGSSSKSFTLPDGSTLALTMGYTVTATSGETATTAAYAAQNSTYAFGSSSSGTGYYGIGGDPVIITHYGQPVKTTLSGITLTDPTGKVLSSVTMAGADAEATNASDESIGWSTTGTSLAELQEMLSVNKTTTPSCTISGVGTSSATCVASASTVNQDVPGYILTSAVTSAQNFAMTSSSSESEGFAFAVNIALLTASETINGRSNSTDELTVKTMRSTTTLASASTSGTGTSATDTALGVVPTDTFTLSEAATSGSLSNYVTTYACTNAVSSSTTLPSGTGTSVSITPAVDDQITCAFTNDGLTLTNAASSEQTVSAPATVTDTFTLTNTSAVAATFAIGTVTVTGSSSGSITPSGYVVGGTTYPTLAAAQGAIGTTAANGSITFGVKYSAPGTAQTISTTLSATTTSGSSASPSVSATATDTMIAPTLAITKTNNSGGSWTIGQSGAQYTITPRNSGTGATTATITVTDTLPTGLTLSAVPSGTGWTCTGAIGASSLSCTSSTAIAAGTDGNAITVPVTIGTSTPVGTNSISNTASIYGGGDSVHTSAGTAATSTANTTTIAAQTTPSITLVLTASPVNPVPGSDVTYTDAFANVGSAIAINIAVTIAVPSGTCLKVGSASSSLGTTGLTATISYSSNGGTSYTYSPVSGACGSATTGYDAAVTGVRWTLSGALSASSPNNSGTVSLTTHIP